MALKSLIVLGAALVVASGARPNFVQCEDTSLCPDGTTCCKVDDQTWGCCPYEFGQCCKDGAHCCPLGYSCDAAQGSCVHKITQQRLFRTALDRRVSGLAQRRRNEIIPGESLGGNVRCPDGNYCLDGQTCCLLTSGSYGCCPYQHAECCSDHTSCCPEGYQCRVSTHQCIHAATNHTVAMVQKVSPVATERRQVEVSVNVNNVRCPDGNYCLDGQTCCLLTSGSYGCCPYQHAECCSDHTSCCPEGYRCRISTHQCVHATTNHTVAMVQKVNAFAAEPRQVEVSANELLVGNVRCPDGNYCLDGQTCCLLSSGQYGCCPYQYAQCCSDHASCCPEGYMCKISTHQCIHAVSNHTVPMVQKVRPVRRPEAQARMPPVDAELVQCPDGSFCQNTQTCCLLKSGRYGCCPYAHAECCSDHVSCCPEGYRCLVSTQQCIHAASNRTVPMLRKVDSIAPESAELSQPKSHVNNVRCPDGNYCLDGQTCCLLTSGSYGCCPYQHAECCSDHTSCCPEGYQCRISTHHCIHATTNHTVAMVQKVNAFAAEPRQAEVSANGITCPDGHKCLNGQTCCALSGGHYGCCPLPEAVCCSDHKTCCPNGYQCQVATQTCQRGDHTVAAVRKLPAFTDAELIEVAEATESRISALTPAQADLLRCPDGSYCQNTQTCCLLVSGHYGCCPYAHAQCCSDHTSCCPEGYRCKVSTRQCIHATSNHSVAAGRKVSTVVPKPILVSTRSNDVTCPDGHKCLSGHTCCPVSSTRYGCCPLPDAVCCDDDKHCCPAGYTCNEGSGTCELGRHSVPMVQRVAAFVDAALIQAAMRDEICPDGNECDDDQTCCQLRSGAYGCCPYNHAVCCDDKVHCCPEGYKCDTQASRCLSGNLASPISRIIQKRISRPMNRILVHEVKTTCPDHQSLCPDKTTCCKSNNTYSCCPFSEATCCPDGIHCCPKGYECDEAKHVCTRRRRPEEELPYLN
ncbi:hypothetical protein HPB52_007459 [Rhipicephalus sanguineus]|uniref:Granulins domain-containing protein n=1 Tax=Rhipicephalus sanguineus TaxID=34632 RepID=A0A9D4PCH6_RHISA|nr:hypothetical protein HPB52_007459 [Rhipicephalus sanguineus]